MLSKVSCVIKMTISANSSRRIVVVVTVANEVKFTSEAHCQPLPFLWPRAWSSNALSHCAGEYLARTDRGNRGRSILAYWCLPSCVFSLPHIEVLHSCFALSSQSSRSDGDIPCCSTLLRLLLLRRTWSNRHDTALPSRSSCHTRQRNGRPTASYRPSGRLGRFRLVRSFT